MFSSSAVETNAGNAAEDPGADAHAERDVLTSGEHTRPGGVCRPCQSSLLTNTSGSPFQIIIIIIHSLSLTRHVDMSKGSLLALMVP